MYLTNLCLRDIFYFGKLKGVAIRRIRKGMKLNNKIIKGQNRFLK